MMSTFPPGGKPCRNLIGRLGYSCAAAAPASTASNASAPMTFLIMLRSPPRCRPSKGLARPPVTPAGADSPAWAAVPRCRWACSIPSAPVADRDATAADRSSRATRPASCRAR